MISIELYRAEMNPDYGSFGFVKIEKELFCVTLEPPDLLNEPFRSCFPPGQYKMVRYSSQKHPDTFEVINVPNRSGILWHPGCLVKNTEGCICVAQYWGKLNGNRAILNSGATFKRFLYRLKDINEAHLTVHEIY